MRMLAGVLRPDAGTISLAGIDVVADPERARPYLSYMPQRFGLYEDLTVDENIFFYATLFGGLRARCAVRAARSCWRPPACCRSAAASPGNLSGGMKQKLGLVCALIHTPQVLLLDEPTTGVDPVSRRDFWGILYGLREHGVTIVLSTAYMDEAERCSRLALVSAGEIRHCDTPARSETGDAGCVAGGDDSECRAPLTPRWRARPGSRACC